MIAYQTALSHRPQNYQTAPGKKDDLIDNIQRLWRELGGTEESWQAYLARNKPSTGATEAVREDYRHLKRTAVPDFALTDLSGRKWQLADLKGKTVFICFWATWDLVSRWHMPNVQKLYDQMKENEDILVLTFNVDFDLGLVEPYLKENKFDFPVILAKDYVYKQNLLGTPRHWVISRDGVLQYDWFGADVIGGEWMKKAIRIIEKVKAGEIQKQ